jgi:hypothetical protein
MTFMHLKEGDIVKRVVGDTLTMEMRVTMVDERLVHCSSRDGFTDGWTFDRETGAEVNHSRGWGPLYGRSGSFLVSESE